LIKSISVRTRRLTEYLSWNNNSNQERRVGCARLGGEVTETIQLNRKEKYITDLLLSVCFLIVLTIFACREKTRKEIKTETRWIFYKDFGYGKETFEKAETENNKIFINAFLTMFYQNVWG